MNIFKKLKEGLSKTRQNIVAGFDNIFSGHKSINDDFYDELEEVMIMGDMGVHATEEILDDLKARVKEQKIKDPSECRQLLIDTIKEKIDLGENAYDYENTRSALLIIGVNGVGKTTSVGKLAASLKAQGRKVMLAAADTFRAGAIDQLKIWGERAGVDVIAQGEGADPGAVVYDAVQAAKARDVDVLIADTAGRLHNKKNLMNELSKIDRIIEREYGDCFRENLIVLDATTGQNAIQQLKEFKEVTDITGIILTKMDGTAKGGIIVAIQAEFGIPVKYIGIGEKIEDLQKFDSEEFVNALFDVELEDDDTQYFADERDEETYEETEADDLSGDEEQDDIEPEVAAFTGDNSDDAGISRPEMIGDEEHADTVFADKSLDDTDRAEPGIIEEDDYMSDDWDDFDEEPINMEDFIGQSGTNAADSKNRIADIKEDKVEVSDDDFDLSQFFNDDDDSIDSILNDLKKNEKEPDADYTSDDLFDDFDGLNFEDESEDKKSKRGRGLFGLFKRKK